MHNRFGDLFIRIPFNSVKIGSLPFIPYISCVFVHLPVNFLRVLMFTFQVIVSSFFQHKSPVKWYCLVQFNFDYWFGCSRIDCCWLVLSENNFRDFDSRDDYVSDICSVRITARCCWITRSNDIVLRLVCTINPLDWKMPTSQTSMMEYWKFW